MIGTLRTSVLASCLAILAATTGCSGSSGADSGQSDTTSQNPTGRDLAPAASVRPTAVTPPPVHGRFDYQLGGSYPPAAGVTIVDRDRAASPAPGIYSICYVNAFQTQPNEASFWTGSRASLVLRDRQGRPVSDPGWPGEHLLDTSTPAKRAAIVGVVGAWFDGCAARGFRAVEPDNLDSWTRSGGRLTQAENVALATALVRRAHAAKLAIAQKNTAELAAAGHGGIGFDFAVAEECQAFGECDAYTGPYGQHVIEIEYDDNDRRYFSAACSARGTRISVILRDRDVLARGQRGYDYRTC